MHTLTKAEDVKQRIRDFLQSYQLDVVTQQRHLAYLRTHAQRLRDLVTEPARRTQHPSDAAWKPADFSIGE